MESTRITLETTLETIPAEIIAEIASWLEDGERALLRETARMFRFLPTPRFHVNLISYGARVGSLSICEMGAYRYHTPAKIYREARDPTILEWARTLGCLWDSEDLAAAVRAGASEAIKWFLDASTPVSQRVLEAAAANATPELFESLEKRMPAGEGALHNPLVYVEAASRTNMPLLEWFRVQGHTSPKTWKLAAAFNNEDILGWALEHKIPCGTAELNAVISCGHAQTSQTSQIVQKLISPMTQGPSRGNSPGVACDEATFVGLAKAGMLDILKFLHSYGAPLQECSREILEAACTRGDLELLTWAREAFRETLPGTIPGTLPVNWISWTCRTPITPGVFEILKYIHEHRLEHRRDNICECAAAAGNLEALEWAISRGYPEGDLLGVRAAAGGHLNILEYLHSRGQSTDKHPLTCTSAAASGHFEAVEWLITRGYPWDATLYDYVILRGDAGLYPWGGKPSLRVIDILRRMRARGMPFRAYNCRAAVKQGNLEILRFVMENGGSWPRGACETIAARGDVRGLAWALNNGCLWDPKICEAAARHGHVHVLDWAKSRGLKIPATLRPSPEHILADAWVRGNF